MPSQHQAPATVWSRHAEPGRFDQSVHQAQAKGDDQSADRVDFLAANFGFLERATGIEFTAAASAG